MNPAQTIAKTISKRRSKGPIKKFPSSDVNKLSRASEVLQLDKETYDPADDSEPTIAVGTEGQGLESAAEQSFQEIEINSPTSIEDEKENPQSSIIALFDKFQSELNI